MATKMLNLEIQDFGCRLPALVSWWKASNLLWTHQCLFLYFTADISQQHMWASTTMMPRWYSGVKPISAVVAQLLSSVMELGICRMWKHPVLIPVLQWSWISVAPTQYVALQLLCTMQHTWWSANPKRGWEERVSQRHLQLALKSWRVTFCCTQIMKNSIAPLLTLIQ